jgi:hypothetical protein
MKKFLEINENEEQDFNFICNEWFLFKDNIIEIITKNDLEENRINLLNESMNISNDVIKNISKVGQLKLKGNDETYFNILYEKIRESKLKDLLVNDIEIQVLTNYILTGIRFNYINFSNVIFILEKIIRNLFEDNNINIILSEKNGIIKYREVGALFDNLENLNKISKICPSIRLIALIYKAPELKCRDSFMKDKNIKWNEIKTHYMLTYILIFLLDLLSIKKQYIEINQKISRPLFNEEINEKNIAEIIKKINNKEFYFSFKDRGKIIYLTKDKINILKIKHLMNEINHINKNIYTFNIDWDKLKIKTDYNNKNLGYIYKYLNSIKLAFNNDELFQYFPINLNDYKYLGNESGALYLFKNDSEIKKYFYFYNFYLMSTETKGKMDLNFLKDFMKDNIKNMNNDRYLMLLNPLFHGFNGNYIYCLNLLPIIKEYRNLVNSKLNKNERDIIDFFMSNKNFDILGNMRHGVIPSYVYDFYGFILFNIFCLFICYEKMYII